MAKKRATLDRSNPFNPFPVDCQVCGKPRITKEEAARISSDDEQLVCWATQDEHCDGTGSLLGAVQRAAKRYLAIAK